MAKADGKNSRKTKKAAAGTALKLPKGLRKFGPLKALMKSDLGREILADALIAAAAAAAAALTKPRTAKKAGATLAEVGGQGADSMQTAAGAVAGAVAEAARHLLPAALVSEEGEAAGRSDTEGRKPRYMNLASDHSTRKTTRKTKAKEPKKAKAPKAEKTAGH